MRWLVLIAAIQQIVVPYFVNPFDGGQARFRADSIPSGIEPAGYAFSIWGPIYGGALAFAIWQLLPAGRGDPASARVALPVLLLYAGSSIWLALAKYGPVWGTMPVLAAMAVCATWALWTATSTAAAGAGRFWFMVLPFALYAGWTCCATVVNLAEVAPGYGWDRFGLSRDAFALVSIGFAAGLAVAVLWLTRGNLVFAGTVAWALVAIAVAARTRGLPAEILWASVGGIAVVAIAAWAMRGKPLLAT